jgi:predicted O-methyltransferase YrrM
LVALLGRMLDAPCNVHGISPFSPAGDSVSRYKSDIDYHSDTLDNFKRFNLPRPQLLKAYSTDAEALKLIASRQWDAIYIDGNHDYEVARQDWERCSAAVRPGGFIVLDDAALATAFHPPGFATAGHPGPSRLAKEIDASRFEEILRIGHNRVFYRKP